MRLAAGSSESLLRPPLLASRYVVKARVGIGGTCSVYLAYDLSLRAWRAAKVMHASSASDPDLRERFLREAVAMANLDHPNIVRVVDVAYETEIPWLVMELVEGGSVAHWLKRNGRMEPAQALDAAIDLCSALEAIHAVGIVHRDVKPHNVLADRHGTCKLTDFGVASLPQARDRAEDLDHHATSAGTVMGTIAFMAPEQRVDSSAVDARADVYAAGATLYSFLTGRGAPDLSLVGKSDRRIEALPPLIAPVVLRACAFRAEDRYAAASAMREALEAVRRLVRGEAKVPLGAPMDLSAGPPRSLSTADVESLTELVRSGAATRVYESPGGTAPSIAPRSVPPSLTPRSGPPPDEESEERPAFSLPSIDLRKAGPAAIGLAGLLGVVAIVGAVVGASGARELAAAERQAIAAERHFHLIIDRHRALVGDLVALGADRKPLEDAFDRFDTAPPTQHARTADVLYQLLEHEFGRVDAASARGMAASAMGDLRDARGELEASVSHWRETAGTPAGWVAVRLGLATAPP